MTFTNKKLATDIIVHQWRETLKKFNGGFSKIDSEYDTPFGCVLLTTQIDDEGVIWRVTDEFGTEYISTQRDNIITHLSVLL